MICFITSSKKLILFHRPTTSPTPPAHLVGSLFFLFLKSIPSFNNLTQNLIIYNSITLQRFFKQINLLWKKKTSFMKFFIMDFLFFFFWNKKFARSKSDPQTDSIRSFMSCWKNPLQYRGIYEDPSVKWSSTYLKLLEARHGVPWLEKDTQTTSETLLGSKRVLIL